MEFIVGDIIKCIDANESGYELILHKLYRIIKLEGVSHGIFIHIETLDGKGPIEEANGFYPSRFIKV